MRSLDGRVDLRNLMALSLQEVLKPLCTSASSAQERLVHLVPTCGNSRATRRIISEVSTGQRSPSLQPLSQQPLGDILRFLAGCRDLTLAFVGVEAAGPYVLCLGDIREIRRAIVDAVTTSGVTSWQQPGLELPRRMHWRTEERLECTFAAVDELLDQVSIRRDVAFVAVWRLVSDAPARMAHSMDVPFSAARQYLREFDCCVLSNAESFGSSPEAIVARVSR